MLAKLVPEDLICFFKVKVDFESLKMALCLQISCQKPSECVQLTQKNISNIHITHMESKLSHVEELFGLAKFVTNLAKVIC